MYRLIAVLLLVSLAVFGGRFAPPAPLGAIARGKQFAVAAGGLHSARAGAAIHDAGGSVVDVAIATAFTVAVERPFSAGLGGGGFLLLKLAGKPPLFLDFRETAPRRATRDMYLDGKGEVIPGKSVEGGLAVATPGFVLGLEEAHRRWGKLPWAKLLEPAIGLAEEGFPVYPTLARMIASYEDTLKGSILFHADGRPYVAGENFRQTDLAATLRLIAAEGSVPFYRGAIGKKIAAAVKAAGGILDEADLAAYRPRDRAPIEAKLLGHRFSGAPPPSAGGVLMAEMSHILAGFDLRAEARNPAEYVHLVSQAMKRAYADRSALLGDPEFTKAEWRRLLKPEYGARLGKKIERNRNTPSKEILPGQYLGESHGTTNLSVLDAAGNAVAMTLTINESWGAQLVPPGTGIFLNDEMDDFSAKPGAANIFGLTGSEANAIQPGKRPVSSMSPTILYEGDSPRLVLGGAGGSRILSSVYQVLLNELLATPPDLTRSMAAPRLHHQWLPDRLDLEAGLLTETQLDALRAKGHETGPWPWLAILTGVARQADGTIVAVADPRNEGGAEAR